jgi:tetratricopeptide (TPR) repeat protein
MTLCPLGGLAILLPRFLFCPAGALAVSQILWSPSRVALTFPHVARGTTVSEEARRIVTTRNSRRLAPHGGRPLALVLVAALFTGAGCGMVANSQNSQGVRLYQQGNYQQAIAKFQQASTTDPQDPDSYYNMAATYHRMGKASGNKPELAQAESLYNQCLDRDPNHRDCYRGLAVLLAEEQRTDEAQRLLQGWATRYPTQAAPKVELARLAEELGDKQTAKNNLVEALAIDPYDSRALAALGRIHEETGNTAQALSDYERSLWRDRFQPDVAARVAALRAALGPAAPPPAQAGGNRYAAGPTSPTFR